MLCLRAVGTLSPRRRTRSWRSRRRGPQEWAQEAQGNRPPAAPRRRRRGPASRGHGCQLAMIRNYTEKALLLQGVARYAVHVH